MRWVIEQILARAQRPGYRGELRKQVPESDVVTWVTEIVGEGVKSIICLLAADELAFYEVDLLAFYRASGLAVEHIPVEDYQRPPMTQIQLEAVLSAFRRLPAPTLVHCSAGFGRSRMAIEHLVKSLRAEGQA